MPRANTKESQNMKDRNSLRRSIDRALQLQRVKSSTEAELIQHGFSEGRYTLFAVGNS